MAQGSELARALPISIAALALAGASFANAPLMAFGPQRLTPRPRIYADANVPAGLVAFMRGELEWDVLFVLEEDGLRRAPDVKHYQLAHQLRRTLVTMDRDYLDDRHFPPAESAGVLVIAAPDPRALQSLLARLDRELFQAANAALPLDGRKLHAHSDWSP